MDMIKRLTYGLGALAFIALTLSACGGGNGGGGNTTPPASTAGTIKLGTPTSDPNLIPPSTTNATTEVTFYAMVNGNATPPSSLSLDQVDAKGNVISADIAQLYDDGQLADTNRGDRIYTGTLDIPSNTSAEDDYRVSTVVNGQTITSGTMNFWVSGCPATSRPPDPSQAVSDLAPNNSIKIYANEMILKTAPGTNPNVDAINSMLGTSIGGHVVGCIPAQREFLVEFNNPTKAAQLVHDNINTVKSQTDFAIADAFPNVQTSVTSSAAINTSLLCNGNIDTNCQWYLDRIRAPLAWQIAGGGDRQDAVGIIDFGVDCSQDGLPCNGSLPGPDPFDHGTGIAGLIAAPKRSTGMVGVAWNTHLFPLSFFASDGSQYKMNELIAHDMSQPDVRVINVSATTGADYGGQVKAALCNAIGSGRLVVAAAGNANGTDAASCKLTGVYPASYNKSSASCSNGANLKNGLLVVGATDINNNLATWKNGTQSACSNTNYVDLYAPGKDILTLSTRFGYQTRSGTSLATPLVSGAAALLWSAHPAYSPAQIKRQLIGSADTMGAGGNRIVTSDSSLDGKPFLDVYRALGGSNSITTPITTPNGFSLPDINNAPLQSLVSSSSVTVSGTDSPTPINVSGGYYSVNHGPFTSAAGSVHSGDTVQVAVPTSATDDTTTSAQLTIGGVTQACNATTHATHATPGDDDFPEQHNVAPDTDILSNPRNYSGISPETPVHVVGGDYTLDGGTTFTKADGTIGPNQTIQVRVHSPREFSRRATARLTIGNMTIPFSVSTPRADRRPNPFTLSADLVTSNITTLSGLAPNTTITSNPITVTGINVPTNISVSGGQYSVTHNGTVSTYTTHTGVVENGDKVTVQLTTPANDGQTATAILTIGRVSSVFRVTTGVYHLSGTVTGVSGINAIGLKLQDLGYPFGEVPSTPKPVRLYRSYADSAATFTFDEQLKNGAPYTIAVAASPQGYRCTVTGGTNNDGSGTISAADVSNLVVNCVSILALTNGQAASMVIGQPDFTTTPANFGVYGPAYADNSQMMVADYDTHQIDAYKLPASLGETPTFSIGTPLARLSNGGTGANATSFLDTTNISVANGQLFVADAYFNRVGIFNTLPTATNQPSTMDVVVGQPDTTTQATGCTATNLNEPDDISVAGGKLVVADTYNNRILIWNTIPTTDGTAADMVIGQPDFTHCTSNAGTGATNADGLYQPKSVWTDGTSLVVADTNNNRILIWKTFPVIDPTTGIATPPDVVLGQSDFTSSFANGNSDGVVGANTLDSPYNVYVQNGQLFVADYLNNRVLVWNNIKTLMNGQAADYVLGQSDFNSSGTKTVSKSSINGPTNVFVHGKQLYVTGYANSRVLIFTGQ